MLVAFMAAGNIRRSRTDDWCILLWHTRRRHTPHFVLGAVGVPAVWVIAVVGRVAVVVAGVAVDGVVTTRGVRDVTV